MKLKIQEYIDNKLYLLETDMCRVFAEAGSDKSTLHNYTTLYSYIFKNLKNDHINLFELGIGSTNINIKSNMGSSGVPGASLRSFATYFPNANIYGADIDSETLFQTSQIKTYYCDQTNPRITKTMWDNIGVDFDIIIDDGLHEPMANIKFFTNSFHKLKINGIYIIEDIRPEARPLIYSFLKTVKCQFYTVLSIPTKEIGANRVDNTIAIIVK
jgi:hypothetical protein